MEFPVDRRRHPNTYRAEVVGARIPSDVDRHGTEPPDRSDGVPDGKMMQVALAGIMTLFVGAWYPCLIDRNKHLNMCAVVEACHHIL